MTIKDQTKKLSKKETNFRVKDFYDNWKVENYPNYVKNIMKHEEDLIFNIFDENKKNGTLKLKEPVVDCGCGYGSFYNLTKDLDTIYIDFSQNLLDIFKNNTKISSDKLLCANIENLPLKDNFASTILCINVLEHVNITKAMNELTRVLKDDGTIVLIVVNKDSFFNEDVFTDWKIEHNLLNLETFNNYITKYNENNNNTNNTNNTNKNNNNTNKNTNKNNNNNSSNLKIEHFETFYFVHPIFKILPNFLLDKILKLSLKYNKKISKSKLKSKGQFLMVQIKKYKKIKN
ncbi:class I SAM-dependent methyltransferase [Methanococcus voltae]|uniref:Methyltransferase type 11 n=1 Tax=Methanococcus voltae (strain ATCC BAA-1334 / A3) TaxID=456320 RepID=D7DUE5_METV3|nr:class I SAM-dependent methyltransferase [Methanococcus voltae]MCS3900555.1 ubiquinone/menaquinone biosynthesis C-methylase UbiE [Methanococcus voltae]